MSESQLLVGSDGAQAQCDSAVRPIWERWAVTNDDAGMAALVAPLQVVASILIVLEATGGSQRAVVAALAAADLRVVVVNPRQARDVAKATGKLAKTDVLDARACAHVADAVRPAEQNRLSGVSQCLRAAIQAHIPGLDTPLAMLDDDRAPTLRANPMWREREALLRSMPGLGPGWTRTLRLDLPEWGTLSRQRLAARFGVVSFHRDRSTLRGTRTTWGDRSHVRVAWYMST